MWTLLLTAHLGALWSLKVKKVLLILPSVSSCNGTFLGGFTGANLYIAFNEGTAS
jgi:hypothetical protein